MAVNIDRPIIIVGTGRCGSTLLHRIMADHDHVGWLSPYNEVFPTQLWLSAFSRMYGIGAFNSVKSGRYFPKPFEAYKFWEHYLPGFSRRDKPQTAADVPADGIGPVRTAVSKSIPCAVVPIDAKSMRAPAVCTLKIGRPPPLQQMKTSQTPHDKSFLIVEVRVLGFTVVCHRLTLCWDGLFDTGKVVCRTV